MDLISLLVLLAVLVIVVAVAYWLINQLGLDPMAQRIITIVIVVIVAIIAIVLLLRLGGLGGSLRIGSLQLGEIHASSQT